MTSPQPQVEPLIQLNTKGSEGEPRLKLVEVYDSIKGEGTQAGVPMTFVRFSKCNLACDFCDTPYNRIAMELTEDELFNHIVDREPAWVVFTGGEPCLQLKPTLTKRLRDRGIKMAIETNGMVWTESFRHLDYICISPKKNYTDSTDPIEPTKQYSRPLIEAANDPVNRLVVDEVRILIKGKDDDFDPSMIPFEPKAISFSPLMYDREPQPGFASGVGHKSMYGDMDQAAYNRCAILAHKWRHKGGRISLQTHKFAGVR